MLSGYSLHIAVKMYEVQNCVHSVLKQKCYDRSIARRVCLHTSRGIKDLKESLNEDNPIIPSRK
jgi:hypothetical protein